MGYDLRDIRLDLNPDLVRRAHMCASTEIVRSYLCGVRVEPNKDGGATLIATDGRKMVAIRDASAVLSDLSMTADDHHSAGVTIALTKDTLRALNNPKAARLIIEQYAATVYAMDASKLHVQATAPFCDSQGYPDWRRVLPGRTFTPNDGDVVFDQRVLSILAEALASDYKRSKQRPLKILTNGEASPALVFGDLHDAFGVALPMRWSDVRTNPPSWVNS